jgi:hypothetical protein
MKRYTENEKQHALLRLKQNYGDVPLTSLQTRFPERTLYDWKRKLRLQTNLDRNLQQKKITAAAATAANPDNQLPAQPDTAPPPDSPEPPHEYLRFRANLVQHIDTLLQTLSDDPDLAHRRAIALTRLLDKVITLESLVKERQPITIRYEFRQYDGSLKPTPPFQVHDHLPVDFTRNLYAEE